jgi:FkbM family methyltransferase
MYYSQDGQDQFLETNVFKGHKNGFFVDVGAHDGKSINNTLYFETNSNWKGINVEPITDVYDRLVVNRPNCINLNCAVDENEGEAEFIYNKGYTEMISGLKNHYDCRHHTRLVNENNQFGSTSNIISILTNTLSNIFKKHNVTHVNYLSIDVEGAEFAVIKSIDFNSVFIDVIGFENNYTDISVPIVEYLSSKGYILLYKCLDIFMIHKNSKFAERHM